MLYKFVSQLLLSIKAKSLPYLLPQTFFDLLFNYLSKNCPFLRFLVFAEQTAVNVLEKDYFTGKTFSQTDLKFTFLSFPKGSLPIFIPNVSLSCSGTQCTIYLEINLKILKLSISINKYICTAGVRSLVFNKSCFG